MSPQTRSTVSGKRSNESPAEVQSPVGRTRRRSIPVAGYAVLVVAVFIATIGIGALAGGWQLSGRTTAAGSPVALQGADVAEIKGWMTIGDVANAWSVPLPELLAAFELPADTPPSTAIKDLESDVFSVTTLRAWLEKRSQPGSDAATSTGPASSPPASGANPRTTTTVTTVPSAAKTPNPLAKHAGGAGHPNASGTPPVSSAAP